MPQAVGAPAKTSSRPVVAATAAGSAVSAPPCDNQVDQLRQQVLAGGYTARTEFGFETPFGLFKKAIRRLGRRRFRKRCGCGLSGGKAAITRMDREERGRSPCGSGQPRRKAN